MEGADRLAIAERLADALDRGVSRVCLVFCRIALPLMVACGVLVVLGRHLRIGSATELKEMVAILFFGTVMVSLGYAYLRNAHVRIELPGRTAPARLRAAIEALGCGLVVAPFCAVLGWYGGESAWLSFVQGETLAFGGWPLQWAVRLAVPLGALLLLVAAIAITLRCLRPLSGNRRQAPAAPGGRA